MTARIVVLKVGGMHCQSCANSIEVALRSEKGVKEARVEFEKRRAMISFDSTQVDEGRIRKVITEAGYRVA
jgi:copper chaperone CopZ